MDYSISGIHPPLEGLLYAALAGLNLQAVGFVRVGEYELVAVLVLFAVLLALIIERSQRCIA